MGFILASVTLLQKRTFSTDLTLSQMNSTKEHR
jgi:hypothetical protein